MPDRTGQERLTIIFGSSIDFQNNQPSDVWALVDCGRTSGVERSGGEGGCYSVLYFQSNTGTKFCVQSVRYFHRLEYYTAKGGGQPSAGESSR
jgi:hypothetical protein